MLCSAYRVPIAMHVSESLRPPSCFSFCPLSSPCCICPPAGWVLASESTPGLPFALHAAHLPPSEQDLLAAGAEGVAAAGRPWGWSHLALPDADPASWPAEVRSHLAQAAATVLPVTPTTAASASAIGGGAGSSSADFETIVLHRCVPGAVGDRAHACEAGISSGLAPDPPATAPLPPFSLSYPQARHAGAPAHHHHPPRRPPHCLPGPVLHAAVLHGCPGLQRERSTILHTHRGGVF